MDRTKLLMTGAAAALLTFSGFAADAKAKPAAKAKPVAKAAAKPAAKAKNTAKAPAKKVDPFSVLPAVVAEMNGKKVTRQEIVNFFKKLSPDIASVSSPNHSRTVAPMSAKLSRVPRLMPCFKRCPIASMGVYSRE